MGIWTSKRKRNFLTRQSTISAKQGGDVVIPPTVNTVFRTYPDGAMAAPYGSHIIDLSQGEEKLWSKVHSKHRNVIRNATKKGVIIKSGPEYIETAYNLAKESFSRSANGFMGKMRLEARMDYESFRRQVIGFGEYVKVFVAEYEGSAQACVVIPFSQHCAYYMHGGSIDNPLTGAMNLLQWESIRMFSEQGVKYYDFCGARIDPEKGSKAEGIIKYKEDSVGIQRDTRGNTHLTLSNIIFIRRRPASKRRRCCGSGRPQDEKCVRI